MISNNDYDYEYDSISNSDDDEYVIVSAHNNITHTNQQHDFYGMLDSRYYSIAELLWIQYKCNTAVDLFDSFIVYVE